MAILLRWRARSNGRSARSKLARRDAPAPLAVLVAFYSVLTEIAELHGAHWLWIADLSKPELLPVRILPLLMILTQLLVAKITPTPTGADPRMARLMTLMSLVFGIVL